MKNSDSLRCTDLWLWAGGAVSAEGAKQRGVYRQTESHLACSGREGRMRWCSRSI